LASRAHRRRSGGKRAERERLTFRELSPGFVGTVSEAIDLIG
jgi:hypothetical protein